MDLRAPSEEQDRIDELADKCNEGTLSDEERAEYENYVRAIHFLGIVQAKVLCRPCRGAWAALMHAGTRRLVRGTGQ